MKGILIGAIETSPDEPYPAPVISVDYDSETEALHGAKLLESLQNGVCPLKVGQDRPVYMGDTAIKISLTRRVGDDILCEVLAMRDQRHITCAFYGASRVTIEQVKAFLELKELHNSYTFTVSHSGRVMTRALDVVKYHVYQKGV